MVYYASVGKTDLATAEARAFLDATGKNGRKIMLAVFRERGIEVPPQAELGSTEQLNKAIEDYIEQIRIKSGLSEYVTPGDQDT